MKPTSALRALQILGLNAVPAAGYFGAGWSPATTLLLYWTEGIFMAALITARIVLHRRATRKRGHYQARGSTAKPHGKGTLLQAHLWVAVPFNLVHGIFLFSIVFLLLPQLAGSATVGFDLGDFRTGLIGITIMLCAGFILDLPSLEHRPFRWIEQLVERSRGRVVLIHLSILFGMAAMVFRETPRTFFMVFVALKTLSDLGWLLPQGEVSSEPPGWVAWIGRLKGGKTGESFTDYWRRTHEADERTRQENEEIIETG